MDYNLDDDADTCCICMKDPPNYVIYKCGHKVLCEKCAAELKKN